MPATLLDGKSLAARIEAEVRARVEAHRQQGRRAPRLAALLVGDDPASAIYVARKEEACARAGLTAHVHRLEAGTDAKTFESILRRLDADPEVDGILVQLPLPASLASPHLLDLISPEKDVDGFHPENVGRLALRRPALRPCTPAGVMRLLALSGERYYGRHAVVVGASNIVGRPMALELLLAGATVTICHRFTKGLEEHVARAEILVAAAGRACLIPGSWIRPGATVVDVGIHRLGGRLVGDVDFATARERAAWITPVPGGVGPMTVAMLLENTLKAYEIRHGYATMDLGE
jgi:methylenetetrahydrofolate dehydrogenase (NADP+)/methenyltetrahydrofolate cyclohydrolase